MIKQISIPLLLCASLVYGADSVPSEASVKQLMEVMQLHKNVDAMMGQMDAIMKNAFQQATQGQSVPPEAQEAFDKCRTEVVTALKEQFTWEKLEPMHRRIYQKSFSQEEVDGMIAFYKTSAGQSIIGKMPLVMQNTMSETMKMMGPMMQRVQAMQQEVAAKMRSKENKSGS